jgi:hypothetical protein
MISTCRTDQMRAMNYDLEESNDDPGGRTAVGVSRGSGFGRKRRNRSSIVTPWQLLHLL